MLAASGPRIRPKLRNLYRRCRCYTCLAHPDHATILRRPATRQTTPLFNWALTTAFYSSVVCTGAVLDVKLKQRRRYSLDQAILQTEKQIDEEAQRQARRLRQLGIEEGDELMSKEGEVGFAEEEEMRIAEGEQLKTAGDEQLRAAEDGAPPSTLRPRRSYAARPLDVHQGERQSSKRRHTASTHTASARNEVVETAAKEVRDLLSHDLSDLLFRYRFDPLDKTEISFSPNSIYRPRSHPRQSRPTMKKVMISEYAAAELATGLLLATGSPGKEKKKGLEEALGSIWDGFKTLFDEDPHDIKQTPRLNYPRYSGVLPEAEDVLYRFSRANRKLINAYKEGKMTRATLGQRLSRNILVSPVAPDVVGYTGLVHWLSQAKEYKLANLVIRAMAGSNIRHDEMSVGTTIRHFLNAGMSRAFVGWHETLEGQHSGLMLAGGTAVDERHYKIRTDKGTLATDIVWNDYIYSLLFSGYVRLGEIEKALEIRNQMVEAGHAPDMSMLQQVMHHFNKRKDFAATLRVWSDMRSTALPSDPHERVLLGSPAHLAYRQALHAAQASGQPELRRQILLQALERGLSQDYLLSDEVPRGMAISSSAKALMTRVQILQRQGDALEAVCNRYSLFVLASQMRLRGYSRDNVLDTLEDVQDQQSAGDAWALVGCRDPMAVSAGDKSKRYSFKGRRRRAKKPKDLAQGADPENGPDGTSLTQEVSRVHEDEKELAMA